MTATTLSSRLRKWVLLLVIPGIASIVYHVWLRHSGAAFDDALIVPFVMLLLVQLAGIPIAYLACRRFRTTRSFPYLVTVTAVYIALAFYSLFYPLGLVNDVLR